MDTRWKQRFANYKKALVSLTNAVELYRSRELSDFEKQGVIHGFEFTHELCWKVMQDFLRDQGETSVYGSKDATRLAFNRELIAHGQEWMNMIADRNLTSHTYRQEISEEILSHIVHSYYPLFLEFEAKMNILWTTG